MPATSPEILRGLLNCEAERCGATLRIAPADPLDEDLGRLRRWIDRGAAADMAYMTRDAEQRADPGAFLPDARSVVLLAVPCAAPGKRPEAEGRVARFAWGQDYHDRLAILLRDLAEVVRSQRPNARLRLFADAQPVLERALARRAGLGSPGRNTMLIRRDLGSHFHIAGLVTDIDLAPDAPCDEDICGDCRRCVEACPTGALSPDGFLDARRCLSYLTIEHRGTISDPLARAMGDRLFGCDTCQEICPLSPPARSTAASRNDVAAMPLADILAIRSNRRFDRLFAGSALKRTRRAGLVRNALIVAANLGRSDLASAMQLLAGEGEKSETVRQTARWALARLDEASA